MLEKRGKRAEIAFKESIYPKKCDGLGLNITPHRTFSHLRIETSAPPTVNEALPHFPQKTVRS